MLLSRWLRRTNKSSQFWRYRTCHSRSTSWGTVWQTVCRLIVLPRHGVYSCRSAGLSMQNVTLHVIDGESVELLTSLQILQRLFMGFSFLFFSFLLKNLEAEQETRERCPAGLTWNVSNQSTQSSKQWKTSWWGALGLKWLSLQFCTIYTGHTSHYMLYIYIFTIYLIYIWYITLIYLHDISSAGAGPQDQQRPGPPEGDNLPSGQPGGQPPLYTVTLDSWVGGLEVRLMTWLSYSALGSY